MLRSCPSRSSAFPPRALALILGFLLCFPFASWAEEGTKERSWLTKAKAAEQKGNWLDACRCFEEVLRKNPQHSHAKAGHQYCLRRLHLLARHSDASYRKTVASLKQPQALTTYEQVLQILAYSYPDSARAELTQLLHNGIDEVKLALDDPVFRQHYLAGVKPAAINAFKTRLTEFRARKMTRTTEVRELVGSLIRDAGKDGLPVLGPLGRALVMEFAAGACNGLDENSSFLTPNHLAMLQSSVRGRLAGVGIEVAHDENGPKVARIYKDSPAEKSIQPGDRILKVAGHPVAEMTSGEIASKLMGKAGSSVKIEIERKSDGEKTTVELKRNAAALASVESRPEMLPAKMTPIGYLRINYFTEDTLREVKDHMDRLLANGPLAGLIFDLRGNPGGVFNAAISVAELFLSSGVISVGQSSFGDFNKTFETKSPGQHDLPIVVLIDTETASAAEVLAAALKESRLSGRTRLFGQTTYGKGSIQCLIQLKNAPLDKTAGIRLTVAKLYSPSAMPITGKGVAPDIEYDPEAVDFLDKAKEVLQELLPANAGAVAKNNM